jgi:hypothetical protein
MSLPGTARRCLVLQTENVKTLPDASSLEDALQANSFDAAPPMNAASKTRQGWCLPDNFLDCDFHTDLDRWNGGDCLRFQYRLEEPAVNQKLAAAHLDRRVRDWCKEHGRHRCPRGIKDEMRDEIEAMLAVHSGVRLRTVDVAWNLLHGTFWLGTTNDNMFVAVEKLFKRSFGLSLIGANPFLTMCRPDLARAWLDSPRRQSLASLFDTDMPLPDAARALWPGEVRLFTQPVEDLRWFLLWLARYDRPFGRWTVALEDRIVLKHGNLNQKTTLTGGLDPANMLEIDRSLLAHKMPDQVQVTLIQEGGIEIPMTLRSTLEWTGLGLKDPSATPDDPSSRPLDTVSYALDQVFAAWVEMYVGDGWPGIKASIFPDEPSSAGESEDDVEDES